MQSDYIVGLEPVRGGGGAGNTDAVTPGVNVKHIIEAVDRSVERLGTYIDVLQIQKMDHDVPPEEIIQTIHGWHEFISMQGLHKLLYRASELGKKAYCNTGVGLFPSREQESPFRQLLFRGTENGADKAIVERVGDLAGSKGISMAQVVQAWLISNGCMSICALEMKERIDQAINRGDEMPGEGITERKRSISTARSTIDDDRSSRLTSSALDELNASHIDSSTSVSLSIDTDISDADSAMGIDVGRASSSASVASSVYRFVEEFGRTYHAYKEGKYFLPNDEQEQSRLDLQHAIALRIFDNELGLAPVSKPNRVLDIGTGTGIWAIEFADRNPESEVLGTDLSPIQPEYVPANCHFEIDDAEDEWAFSQKFDYVHGRYMCTSIFDLPKLFGQIRDNLNPGGWVEFQETVIDFKAVDGSLEGTALRRWNDHLLEGIRKAGRDALSAFEYARHMTDAGFQNVQQKKFAVPASPWAKGRNQKILGAMQMTNNLEGVQGITMKIFTQVLGWTREDAELLLVDVRKDMADKNIHAYITV
ncbi:methyltransferase domain-containing protein [Colletotrichum orchidophilum]|uniref:Methyltransferase domain-containing protein n=1 Tax=Colletotrichum orchidophilum TaxID=1209926 RepID=A0A1G4BKM2_9PEZI|nr:methyltransferase domain-containing protein [Colletotrichum orchidophilum]OHF01843.1 methyltransferase domain-containing protein [Colletotrichum orchidophilum]